jgi:hypothetical protein
LVSDAAKATILAASTPAADRRPVLRDDELRNSRAWFVAVCLNQAIARTLSFGVCDTMVIVPET